MLVCATFYSLRTRPRVQRAPGFPCALDFERGRNEEDNSGKSCREKADTYPGVIPAKAGIQYAVAHRLKNNRLWNTGSPACAGDDTGVWVRILAT